MLISHPSLPLLLSSFPLSTPSHPPLPFVPSSLAALFSSLPLLWRFFSHGRGESIWDERNCISAQFATGTLQYLIKGAFVWRKLWICVRVSDKERCLTSVCVWMLYLYAGERQKGKKKDRSVYICVCGDSFRMKGFLQSYGNWFTISLFPCFGPLAFFLFPSPPLLHFPSPPQSILFPTRHHATLPYCTVLYMHCYVGLIHSKAVLSGLFDFAVCAYVTVCACISGWSQWSPGRAEQHISSSSRLGTRKP